MRVLVDECAPRALKLFLAKNGHACHTVQEAGWAGIQNGELLSLAEAKFDVLVTIDTNILYQQSLKDRKIAIILIRSASNRLDALRIYSGLCQGIGSDPTWRNYRDWRSSETGLTIKPAEEAQPPSKVVTSGITPAPRL